GRRLARVADAEVVDRPARALRRLALRVGLLLHVAREAGQERVQLRLPSARTGLRRTPTPSTSTSTTSPALNGLTPAGVPVETMSPSSSVMPAQMKARSFGRGKIWSLVLPSCLTAP